MIGQSVFSQRSSGFSDHAIRRSLSGPYHCSERGGRPMYGLFVAEILFFRSHAMTAMEKKEHLFDAPLDGGGYNDIFQAACA
jgi:hypothetical protein